MTEEKNSKESINGKEKTLRKNLEKGKETLIAIKDTGIKKTMYNEIASKIIEDSFGDYDIDILKRYIEKNIIDEIEK